jgi:PAS domain S-box-containing protein
MKASPVVTSEDNRIDAVLAPIERVLRHAATARVVLVLLLLATAIAWAVLDHFVVERARDRFNFESEDISDAIRQRLINQAQALAGSAGLFAASKSVERDEWRDYVRSLNLERNYPGLLGFGYSQVILPHDLDQHIRAVRREGFPDYTVRPPGARAFYTAIVYMEPFSGRNLRAFGFDMYSEPVRRAAMERGRDSGEVTISGKVTLVQETQKDVQYGFLMYLPIYRNGAAVQTLEQRRRALQGFVYSPFRVNDFIAGAVQSFKRNIEFEIYDGNQPVAGDLMYASNGRPVADAALETGKFSRSVNLDFGGRGWLIRFTSAPGYMSLVERSKSLIVALGGVLIDVLVFLVLSAYAGQRRRAEALALRMTDAVRASTAREHAIVNNVADGILTLALDGTIDSCNAPASRMFGVRGGRLTGQSIFKYLCDPHHAQLKATLANPAALQSASHGLALVVEGKRRDGEVFSMELALSQAELDDQRFIIAIVRDITERRKVERMKDEFISTVSHELRTPLTAICGSLNLLAAGHAGALPAPAGDLVTVALRNGKRLLSLINDILDFEALNSKQMTIDLQPRPLAALLRQALQAMHDHAAEFKVRLRLVNCLDDATVLVDEGRFQQVLANLLSNAVKYSPSGAEVDVQAERFGEGWRISVQDRGTGIPEHLRDRIFEKFFQADSSDTRQHGGTGLGLHISKILIERMGGTIGYDSTPGVGTRFWLDMPAPAGAVMPVVHDINPMRQAR